MQQNGGEKKNQGKGLESISIVKLSRKQNYGYYYAEGYPDIYLVSHETWRLCGILLRPNCLLGFRRVAPIGETTYIYSERRATSKAGPACVAVVNLSVSASMSQERDPAGELGGILVNRRLTLTEDTDELSSNI